MRAATAPIVMALALAAASLGGCQKQLEAPIAAGVCWQLVQPPGGAPKFNKLASGQPDLEHCAAQLEMMRLRFAALGAGQTEVTGAYQGQFLFLQRQGVFTSQSYGGYRYPFMVRTGDGRLAVPGAMPQAPQR
ncbi:MAG: hypothetical protein ABI376_01985 [Caulobacteraceae bacterium]